MWREPNGRIVRNPDTRKTVGQRPWTVGQTVGQTGEMPYTSARRLIGFLGEKSAQISRLAVKASLPNPVLFLENLSGHQTLFFAKSEHLLSNEGGIS